MWVIINKSKKDDEFYSIDNSSGGHPYWSASICNAKFFTSYKSADDALKLDDFTKECNMANGVIYPPRMIQNALNICNAIPSAKGHIIICSVNFNNELTVSIEGCIIKQKERQYITVTSIKDLPRRNIKVGNKVIVIDGSYMMDSKGNPSYGVSFKKIMIMKCLQ